MNADLSIQRLQAVARRQHKALSTEETYVYWLRRYMAALPRYPAMLTSEQKVERFLSDLVRHRDISASSQNQAFNAILFFYKDVLGQPLQGVDALRATRPARMRHAPSISDTQALLETIRNVGGYPTNLIARLLYGCGTARLGTAESADQRCGSGAMPTLHTRGQRWKRSGGGAARHTRAGDHPAG
jgi:hypothetical protein